MSLYEKKFKKVDFTNFFPKSYLLTSLTLKQWAAVTMIFSVISDPPQINSNFELACFLTEIWAIHGNWPTIAFWPPTILDPLGKEFLPQNSGCSMSKCLDVFAKDGKKLLSWKTAPFSLISLVSNFGGLINRERLKLWQNFVKMNRMKIFDVHTIFCWWKAEFVYFFDDVSKKRTRFHLIMKNACDEKYKQNSVLNWQSYQIFCRHEKRQNLK